MKRFLQIFTTTAKKEEAEQIARVLVEKQLAGCVQVVGPIQSTYRWKGNVEVAEEWLCIIKSEERLFQQLEEAIKAIHPYETPEIVAMPIVAGSKNYLEWLDGELKTGS